MPYTIMMIPIIILLILNASWFLNAFQPVLLLYLFFLLNANVYKQYVDETASFDHRIIK